MVILVMWRVQKHVTPWYKSDHPRVVPPFRYGQGILMGIPHHIILSNIIGRWGAMFHMKHERLFAISWGLFHFHTSDTLHKISPTPTNSPPTNRITKPFTGDGEVLITPLENTLYNHPPLSNNRIVSYIYTNYHPSPTTVNHNYKSSYKYHLPA